MNKKSIMILNNAVMLTKGESGPDAETYWNPNYGGSSW